MAHPSTEMSDVAVRPIVYAGAAIVLIVALVFGLSLVLYRFLVLKAEPAADTFPPTPRIEIDPAAEYQRLRAEEDQKLSSYGWVDRPAGKVRIPIEKAIDLQLQRGFPTGAKK